MSSNSGCDSNAGAAGAFAARFGAALATGAGALGIAAGVAAVTELDIEAPFNA